VILLLAAAGRLLQSALEPAPPQVLAEGPARVERVVDGDTLLLVSGARVRLQGIDAPETKHPDLPVQPWGPQASRFTADFIGERDVHLRFDRERIDQYGRFLAYVYVGDRMLNEELLRAGLARARLEYNYSDAMKRRFKAAQAEAKEAGRGIWSADERPGATAP